MATELQRAAALERELILATATPDEDVVLRLLDGAAIEAARADREGGDRRREGHRDAPELRVAKALRAGDQKRVGLDTSEAGGVVPDARWVAGDGAHRFAEANRA